MLDNIFSNHDGGNILKIGEDGKSIYLAQDQRTTKPHWFYYNFCVKNAPKGSYDFIFTHGDIIGPAGPAISSDSKNWHFLNDRIDDHGFSYAFKGGETVYFAFCPYYGEESLDEFLRAHSNIKAKTLCNSNKGREVPMLILGDEDKPSIVFTSRHHSCESPGTYALLGALEYLEDNSGVLDEYSIIALPFMDMDGVVDGDQGKSRAPHDHNRDYKHRIYNEVDALCDLTKNMDVAVFIDFHAPWYYGGRNDTVFMVLGRNEHLANQNRFGKILTDVSAGNNCKLGYDAKNNIGFGVEWNTENPEGEVCSVDWFKEIGTPLAFTLETTYTGLPYGVATQENIFALGKSVGQALEIYLQEH